MNQTPRPVAVVTGATSGMGRAIVLDLAHDWQVVAVGRDATKLADLAGELEQAGTPIDTWLLDLAQLARGELPGAQEQAAALPRVDALVHAAAVGGHHRLEDATLALWHEQLDTNVIAPAELTRLLLPQLKAAAGTVIFVGSGASRVPVPGSVIYPASKHALLGLAEVLRIDLSADRVRVTSLEPGPINTPMSNATDPSVLIAPESVAASVRFVLEAPADVDLAVLAIRPRVELDRLR